MTETTGATCPTCTAPLPAAGTPCTRCAAGPPAGMSRPASHHSHYPGTPYAGAPSQPAPYAGMPSQGAPYQPLPYQAYGPTAHPSGPYPAYQAAPAPQAFHAGTPYPPMPYQPAPYPVRAPKSPGVAVLLTLLWIGAGHLYLDRVGTGLVLMGAHFFLGLLLFLVFAPLGFVLWLGAAIGCAVWCSNLAAQINAGTVPPRLTW